MPHLACHITVCAQLQENVEKLSAQHEIEMCVIRVGGASMRGGKKKTHHWQ